MSYRNNSSMQANALTGTPQIGVLEMSTTTTQQ